MRRRIVASIIIMMMIWQTIGGTCIALTEEVKNATSKAGDTSETSTASTISEEEEDEIQSKPEGSESEDKENETESNVSTVKDSNKEEENQTSTKTEENAQTVENKKESEPKLEDKKESKQIEVQDQYVTEDDLLYSNKYLVKDKIVSRVDPQTEIKEFEKEVEVAKGNKLKYYKQDGKTEQKAGILGTGMIIRGTNGEEYRISVKGDITGEGEANQVELTMMIRDIIDLKGWKLEDINRLSGDINGDEKVDIVDVNKMIRHIVYGDWEYENRTTPNPPTIEVEGTEGIKDDEYRSEVEVRIIEDKSTENLKTTYKISGTKEQEESSIEEDEKIEIKENGEYLITAYTYGIQGNRSKARNRKIIINKAEEPETYNINYELNGGTNSEQNPSTYTYGTEVTLNPATKEGYTFDGWYKEAEFTNKVEKIESTQKEDVTVYAKWIAKTYNINYELNGGTNSEQNPSTYTYGTEVTLNPATKEGYTFDGWYKEAEFINKVEKIEATQKEDVTVYAKWTAKTYNINYELNGGTNSEQNPSTYTFGQEVVLNPATKEGYTFDGWYKEAEFTNKVEKIESTQKEDVTVYAKWTAKTYNINYELNGGTNSEQNPSTYTYGTEVTLNPATKEGYTFDGWYKEAEFTNKVEKIESTQKEDVTVYAKWTAKTYNITGEAQEGGTIENADETVKYGENSTKQIIITPNENMAVDTITVNNEEFTDYTIDAETRVVTMPIFENVTENKHVVVTFKQLTVVAKIIVAPEGYEALVGKEYISVTNALKDVTADGFTIQLIENTEEEFTVKERAVIIDLNGKNITGNGTTATIESGKLTLINSNKETQGKIISNSGNAVYVKQEGTFNLGQDEGTVEIDNIIIQGNTIGVKTEGIFNFYDGTIKATKAIDGTVNETPIRYNTTVTENEGQEANLKIMAGAEAVIGKKTFLKLEDAIEYANTSVGTDGSQVKIDVINELSKTETIEISADKNIKLNLNGNTISFLNATTGINNSGKLEIVDEVGTGKISSTVTDSILNNEGATLTLTSGTMETTTAGTGTTNTTMKKSIRNKGTLNINGGTISPKYYRNAGIYNEAGTITINGGTIENIKNTDNYSIYDIGEGTIEINGGNIGTVNNGDAMKSSGSNTELTINGGTVKGHISNAKNITINNINIDGQIQVSNGTLHIKDGTFANQVRNYNSEVIIEGGKFLSSGNNYNIYCNGGSNSKTTITGGTFEGDSIYLNSTYADIEGVTLGVGINYPGTGSIIKNVNITPSGTAIQNTSSNEINLENVNILVTNGHGISNQGTINIKNSIITTSSTNYNAISNSGTINLGEKDGVVDSESIKIEGGSYGIQSTGSGKVNFYDGQIIGAAGKSIIGAVGDVEEGYTITKTADTENSKEIAKLEETSNYKVVETNEEYKTIQEAIDAIESTGTIQVINNAINTENMTFNIDENKNITLDLNGKTLDQGGTIENNGTLEITDSSEGKTGTITGYKKMITNTSTGTLKLTNVKINTGYSINNRDLKINRIENSGTLEINGATIADTGIAGSVINNKEEGTTIINSGEITSNGTDYITIIYNEGTGEVEINGGKITGKRYATVISNASSGTITITEGTISGYYTSDRMIINKGTGTINVSGGSIEGYISNDDSSATGTINISGGIVKGQVRNSYGTIKVTDGELTGGINNGYNGNGSTIIEGGTITYSSNTVITNYGELTITGGTIESTGTSSSYYGIYNNGSNAKITIGTKDGDVDVETPLIKSIKSYGVYNNNGILKIYDGQIIGASGQSIYGTVSEIEDDYELVKTADTENSTETAMLKQVTAVVNTTTNAEYYKLQMAIDEANEGETLKVVRNIATLATDASIEVASNKNIVLDLNGYNIDLSQEEAIKNSGTLKILDSSENGISIIKTTKEKAFINNEGGTLELGKVQITSSANPIIESQGTLKITGAKITGTASNGNIINNTGSGTITMESGEIVATSGNTNIIHNESSGEIIINDGILNTNGNYYNRSGIAIENTSSGIITITGGTINCQYSGCYAVKNTNDGTVNVQGGTIERGYISNYGSSATGTINISGGTIKECVSNNYYSTGTIKVTEGKLTGGISNGRGNTIIEGGTITNSDNAIHNSNGTVTITGGTIEYTGTSTGNYGIYNDGSNATVTIGIKDGNANEESPVIKGIKSYGLYNYSGTLKIYDGQITGASGQSIYGAVYEIEDDYELVKTPDIENSTETATLKQETAVVNITTNTEYYKLQTAIDEANEGEVLQAKRNITTLSTDASIEVASGKNVILDLNGYNIDLSQTEAIKNSGTLKILDSSENGTSIMKAYNQKLIVNNEGGTLELGKVQITSSANPIIESQGTLKITGVKITGTASSGNIINNTASGTITMESGEIVATSGNTNIIHSESSGEIIINDGILNTNVNYNNRSGIAIENTSSGIITITGGTINMNCQYSGCYAVKNTNDGTVNVQGGTIERGYISNCGSSATGTINISGGTIKESVVNDYYSTGTIKVTEGELTGGISNGCGNTIVEGGTITNSGNAIYNSNGTVTITGGTITSTNYEGVYNNSSDGTVIIGMKYGNVSKDTPSITGKTYGVYNNGGTFNFYDGVIKGETQAINGSVTEVEDGYEVKYTENSTIAQLELIATNLKIISIGEMYYDNLQTAVNEATDGDTLVIWTDIIIDSTVEIPDGKNLTIDLNGGHTITGADPLFSSTVTTIDSSAT